MIVEATSNVVQDLMETEQERTFWEVVRHHERPPYFSANEGVGNRLARAARVVTDGRLTPNSDGSYTVEGAEGRTYRVREHCSCPDSTYRKERGPCYHEIAVVLYVEWQRRLRPVAPVVLGTLRTGTAPLPPVPDDDELGNGYPVDDETLPLPLSPVTVDERLAQAPTLAERQRNYTQASLPHTAEDNDPQYLTPHTPQEVPMPADAYIPEPEIDEAPVAVLEPRNGMSHDTPMATPLATALVQWSAQRQVVKEFLSRELREGIDFYTLQIRGKASKPSLSKAGAEKFLGLMQLQASFAPDLGTWEMLGKPTDQIMYVCQLRTRSGEIVGEGRGARSLKQDGGDINKALKMSEKSALIDAVLRTGALSDAFTQDAEDLQEEPAKAATPAKPTSQDLRQRIWAQVQKMDGTVRTREQVETFIKERTGMDLHPDYYEAVLARLEGRA